jgi:hypothetical protein
MSTQDNLRLWEEHLNIAGGDAVACSRQHQRRRHRHREEGCRHSTWGRTRQGAVMSATIVVSSRTPSLVPARLIWPYGARERKDRGYLGGN